MNKKVLKFVNMLDKEDLINLINSTKASKDLFEEIYSCKRDAVDSEGDPCIMISAGIEGEILFNYVINDAFMETYLPSGEIYDTNDFELREYLKPRFGEEYIEFLSQVSLGGKK